MNQSCESNNNISENPKILLDSFKSPALLMQTEPRQVVTANKEACQLLGKNLSQVEGYRGGQVFDCIHSFTENGCGIDPNCENCKIKSAVVDTFTTGVSHNGVQTTLDIIKLNETRPYNVQVSTKKIGNFATITIEKYQKA